MRTRERGSERNDENIQQELEMRYREVGTFAHTGRIQNEHNSRGNAKSSGSDYVNNALLKKCCEVTAFLTGRIAND